MTDTQIAAIRKDSDTYKEIYRIAAEQRGNALGLRGYGYPGYFAVSTAALSYISMCSVLRVAPDKVKEFCAFITKWLKEIVDASENTSAAYALQRMQDDVAQRRSAVNGFPRQVFLGFYSAQAFRVESFRDPGDMPDKHPRETVCINWYATLSGDYESALAWSTERILDSGANPSKVAADPLRNHVGPA